MSNQYDEKEAVWTSLNEIDVTPALEENSTEEDEAVSKAQFHSRLLAISSISLSESFQANVIWSMAAFMLEVTISLSDPCSNLLQICFLHTPER